MVRGGRAGPQGPRRPSQGLWLYSEQDEKPLGVSEQRCSVLWIPCQGVTLAVVWRTGCRGTKAGAGRPV